MKSMSRESISRILLIVYYFLLVLSLWIPSTARGMAVLYVIIAFLLLPVMMLRVEKHQKYVWIGFGIVLLLICAMVQAAKW